MPAKLLFLVLAFASFSCKKAPPPDTRKPWDPSPAFWIWNQTTPLPVGVHPLFVQVAEFTADSHKILQPSLASPNDIAVIRLPPGLATLDDPQLKARLFSYLSQISPRQLQLDYDCAAMNLGLYQKFITSLRSQFQFDLLSITALASWIDAPDFKELAQSVDEIAPMFYDLEVDHPSKITELAPLPLIDENTLAWIKKWQNCPVTWRAGLPNYQRLSLFQSSGELIGHLQRWSPSELRDLPGLVPSLQKNTHSFTHRIKANQHYQGVELKKGQLLVWRKPDESLTRDAIKTARDSGASGVIWFAHPDSAPVTWHSLSHLIAIQKGHKTQPDLRHEINTDGSITISNHGPGDLPFSLSQRRWKLSLQSEQTGLFSSTTPGDFETITARVGSLVHPETIREICLSFSQLHSGQSLTSGKGLVVSPEENALQIRIEEKPPPQ